MKKILPFLSLLLCLACSPTESESTPVPEPQPVQESLYIKEIKLDGKSFRTYEYDDEDRLSSYTYFTNGVADFIDTFTYSDERTIRVGLLEGEEYNRSEYYWQDGSTIRQDIIFDGTLTRYILYNFTEETCGHISEELYGASGDLQTTRTIEYVDDLCSRNETSVDARVDSNITLDDRNSFDQNARIFPFEAMGGNIISDTSFNRDGNIADAWSYDSEFVYNEHDYPISETRTYRSGKVEEYEYIYY